MSPHDELIAEARKLANAGTTMQNASTVEGQCAAMIRRLADALEAARADGERLDWLVAGGGKKMAARVVGRDGLWRVCDCSNGLTIAGTGDTYRAAIDQARGITPTPTPDLADRIANAIHEVACLKGDLGLVELRAIVQGELAPTLDALANLKNEYAELQASRDRCMELNCKAEAANAALREKVERLIGVCPHDFEGAARATACIDARALLDATNAGQPLLDELARAKKRIDELCKAGTDQWGEFRVQIEGLENRLTTLRQAGERLAEAVDDIGQYKGEGGPNTPWRDIVRDCGQKARAALAAWREATKDSV